MSDERLADFRRVFAQIVVARGGCDDPKIRAAFERVPRHELIGEGPWCVSEDGAMTASADPALVYQDIGMALAPERGIPTGLPSLHARCIHACSVRPGDRVVHIGAGMGYFTAIFSELVGEAGEVIAYEIDAPLAAMAKEKLRDRKNVRVEATSGVSQIDRADVIYVCAGLQQLPRAWLDALSPKGRLVFPLTPGTEEGGMFLIEADAPDRFAARFICRARFVPCIGAQDASANARLSAAFSRGIPSSIRSLRIGSDPDQTAWFAGDGWWLSIE